MNTKLPDNIRIRNRKGLWRAEVWRNGKWAQIISAPTKSKLLYWWDFINPHPNVDTRASD